MFDAKNAEIVKGSKLKANDLYVGIITDVTDGKVKDFVPESAQAGWKGDLEGSALNVTYEVKDGEEVVKSQQMFTYINDEGKTIVSEKSNLGKYNKMYGKYPESGDQIKITTNAEGFGKIKIE